jgi:hypothetical protein
MPGILKRVGSGLASRPTFERDITRTISPEGIATAPGLAQIQAPSIGPGGEVLPGTNTQELSLGGGGVVQPPPEETRTDRVQVKGAPHSLTFLADFLTGFGGGPQAALQQQAQRRQGVNQIFDQEQANADLLLQRQRQGFQRDLGLRRLGISERDIALREQNAARPKISTFQSRDGRRLLTVNTQTGELINSLNVSEELSPQVIADFISNFENSLGSPLNPNEQGIISAAGQSALQNGDLGVVASALDGIASGREGLRRSRVLSKDVGKRQLFSDQRKIEREQAKNDRFAVQAERQAILRENSAIRKQINTLQRDLFRKDIRNVKAAEKEIIRLKGVLGTNEVQVEELDKELRQLSGKKSFSKQGTQPEPGTSGTKRLGRSNNAQPRTAEELLRKVRGNR